MCLIGAIGISIWASSYWEDHDYLGNQEDSSSLLGFKTYFTYFLLLNTMLPISLIVSLEVLKIIQAYFLQNDIGMYCKERNRRCKVSSSSLNEELGMI
mmetsp:Transcript_12096/g.1818  ORF Transcript_12096/g.1818 Transcript_12096/m.1818 type:complete len:98 (+) Transcript_12096:830-1123(+)